ncbi:hypothetical protein K493DRAFT_295650 [Basidiobolus meristosporus CBS 931.73]|uniref:Uncharacterized protein n=1 Tax=Basidiobolus meristosporus CBS 931.73 TaxID=1314790 RepID=A0A1Y1ZBB2_9FUNG|nr:hypothetical protein K493DRAFT_295650 [Basidiobolus meristosporus CBS 931.73]|eukprot:ORY07075.1 hypothetical protein K493DRAFT_295650 [Basidiobolus meristosporus CBS 931.73]
MYLILDKTLIISALLAQLAYVDMAHSYALINSDLPPWNRFPARNQAIIRVYKEHVGKLLPNIDSTDTPIHISITRSRVVPLKSICSVYGPFIGVIQQKWLLNSSFCSQDQGVADNIGLEITVTAKVANIIRYS